ncbi:MAG: MFS transporter [Hyphomicrobiales bacterium]|nr:MFS transporter [Hyphomicrobiales bacterium]
MNTPPAAPAAPASPGGTRWSYVALAIVAGLAAAAHVGKLPPALPAVRAELGLGLVAGGWVVSVFSATAMALGIFAGTVADRVGHWRLAQVGLVLLGLGGCAGALATGPASLLASRLCEGVGFVAIVVSAPGLIVAATDARSRRLALSFWGCYMPTGSALTMVLAPLLLDAAGWRALWAVVGALALAWAGVYRLAARRAPAHTRALGPSRSLAGNMAASMGKAGPWLISLCFGAYTAQWVSLMVWLPSFLVEQRGAGTAAAGLLTAGVVFANVPGNLAAGWLLGRGVARWVLVLAASAAMGFSAAGIFADGLPDATRYALCLVFSGLGGLLPASVLSSVPVFAPTPGQVGTVNGMLIQGSNVGQFFGPPAAAAVVAASGRWEDLVTFMAAMAAAAAVMAVLIGAAERRVAAA